MLVGCGLRDCFRRTAVGLHVPDARDVQAARVSRTTSFSSLTTTPRTSWRQTACGPQLRCLLFVGRRRAARRPLAPWHAGTASHPSARLPRRRPEHRAACDRLRRDAVLRLRRHIVSVALIVTFTAVPFLFLAGLLGTTMARGAGLGTIFSAVPERASPGEVQEGLRQALCATRRRRSRTGTRKDEHYVDVEGNRFELPADTRDRVVTRLDYADEPVAAIVHDAALRCGAGAAPRDRERSADRTRAGQAARRGTRPRAALLRAPAGHARPDVPHLARREVSSPTTRRIPATSSSDEVVGKSLWDRLPQDLADRVLAAGRAALGGRSRRDRVRTSTSRRAHATTRDASPRAATTSS